MLRDATDKLVAAKYTKALLVGLYLGFRGRVWGRV